MAEGDDLLGGIPGREGQQAGPERRPIAHDQSGPVVGDPAIVGDRKDMPVKLTTAAADMVREISGSMQGRIVGKGDENIGGGVNGRSKPVAALGGGLGAA